MTLPDLTSYQLLHAPWDDPAFGDVIALLAAMLVLSAIGLAIVTWRGRGGAPPRTLWARWVTWLVLAPAVRGHGLLRPAVGGLAHGCLRARGHA